MHPLIVRVFDHDSVEFGYCTSLDAWDGGPTRPKLGWDPRRDGSCLSSDLLPSGSFFFFFFFGVLTLRLFVAKLGFPGVGVSEKQLWTP